MSEQTQSSANTDLPPPVRVLFGFIQMAGGFTLVVPAVIMRLFPITSPIGSALLNPASQLSYNGGYNFGAGFVGCCMQFGRLIERGVQSGQQKLAERQAQQRQVGRLDE